MLFAELRGFPFLVFRSQVREYPCLLVSHCGGQTKPKTEHSLVVELSTERPLRGGTGIRSGVKPGRAAESFGVRGVRDTASHTAYVLPSCCGCRSVNRAYGQSSPRLLYYDLL